MISLKSNSNICKHALCKKNVFSKNYCINHYKKIFLKHVFIIQKFYKGYIVRKKINNIYKKLPEDLQIHIKKFINNDLYIKKEHRIIKNTIFKYSKKIIFETYNRDIQINNDFNIISIKQLTYLFNLYIKYYNIININEIKYLYILGEKIYIILLCHLSFVYNHYFPTIGDIFDIILYNKLNLYQSSEDEITKCARVIEFFRFKYFKNNYNLRQINFV